MFEQSRQLAEGTVLSWSSNRYEFVAVISLTLLLMLSVLIDCTATCFNVLHELVELQSGTEKEKEK